MAEDRGDLREGTPPGVASSVISFTALGDRDEMSNTIVRSDGVAIPNILHEKSLRPIDAKQVAATKYAVLRFLVDNKRTYQLLPQDLQRKVAHIKILLAQANGVLLGPDPVVQDTVHGYPLQNGDPEFLYTAGSPLFAIGTSATAVQVDVLVEMYDGVQTVN